MPAQGLLTDDAVNQSLLTAVETAEEAAVDAAADAQVWAEGADGAALSDGSTITKSAEGFAGDAEDDAGDAAIYHSGPDGSTLSDGVTVITKSVVTLHEEAEAAASRTAASVFAQRVLAEAGAGWADLVASGALTVETETNGTFDSAAETFRVTDTAATFSVSLRVDLANSDADNALYDASRLSYQMHDASGVIPDGASGSVTVTLLSAALAELDTPDVAEFIGAGMGIVAPPRVFSIADLDPGAARYVRLEITGQSAGGDVPLGRFGPSSYQAAGYLTRTTTAGVTGADDLYVSANRTVKTISAAYTIVADDAKRSALRLTTADDVTVEVSSALTGKTVVLVNTSGSSVTIVASGTTLINADGPDLADGGTAVVRYLSASEVAITGDLSTAA